MLCGRSNKTGIMIYDSHDSKGIYGTYNHNEIVLIEGSVEELEKYYKEHSNKKVLHKLMLISLLIEVLMSFYSIFHFPIIISFSLILFFVLSYIKLNTIIYTFIGKYENKEDEKQFKRFHACEHKLLNVEGEEFSRVDVPETKDISTFLRSLVTYIDNIFFRYNPLIWAFKFFALGYNPIERL